MLDFEVSNSKHTLLAFEESHNVSQSTWQMEHNGVNTLRVTGPCEGIEAP